MSEKIKVEEIYIKKFKIIEDFRQNLNGQSVIICGPNEKGKTTTISFIRYLMGDPNVSSPNALPEGEIKITKGGKEYVLKAVIDNKGKSKIIVCADGMEDIRSGTLENLIGATSFDPFGFVEKSKTKAGRKEQVEDIKKLLPEEVQADLARYEADVAAKYEERTGLGKDLKAKEGFIKQHALYNEIPNLSSFKPVDVTELQAKKEAERARLNELYKTNKAANDEARANWNKTKATIDEECKVHNEKEESKQKIVKKTDEILVQLIELGYEGKEVFNWMLSKQKEIKPSKVATDLYPKEPVYVTEMPDDKELQAIDALILSASDANGKYKDAQDLLKKIAEVETLRNQVGELTVLIDSGRQAISDAVKEMSSIINGLSYDDEGLMLNGVPVHPNSLSESQIVALAYNIKRFENPSLPLFVDNLECFDQTKYDALFGLTATDDVQIIAAEVKRDLTKLEFHLIAST